MDKEQSKKKKELFVHNGHRMAFTIITDNLLNIEIERVRHHIMNQGGEIYGFVGSDEYINLASPKYNAPPNQTVFNIEYVKRCVNEKRLMNLNAFQISGPKPMGDCLAFYELLNLKRCPHYRSAEEVLRIMNTAKIVQNAL